MKKQLTIHQHARYGGGSLAVDADLAALPAGFDRTISSARIDAPTAMFTAPDFRGDAVVLTTDTPHFSDIRGQNLNDAIRSIRYEPLRLALNITVGTDDASVPAKSMEDVSTQVAACNEVFAPWGIEVEADAVRVVAGLSRPMTSSEQDRLIEPHLRDDAVNVLFFRGTHWKAESWRWVVQSAEVTGTGSTAPSAELFDAPNFGGTRTRLGGANGPAALDVNGIRSVRVGPGSMLTLYDTRGRRGARIDLFADEADLATRHVIRNWWGSKIGHCCHGSGRLIRQDHRSGRWTLAHELGHWMGLDHVVDDRSNLMFPTSNGGSTITPDQAATVWSDVLSSPARRRVLR